MLSSIKEMAKNTFTIKHSSSQRLVGESITAVNKRVKYYDVNLGSQKSALYQVELTSDTGAK